jgi:flavin reductase (DIM6/NTAB) family NADH-FMN oxidoreductase RutF
VSSALEADEGAVGSGEALRHVMANFVAGVTVVSTIWRDIPHAMTATAVSSVSLDPPLVLVCVGKKSRFHEAVLGAGRWAMSLLRSDQEQIARHFANRGRDLNTQFDQVPHRPAPVSGAPLIDGAHAWLECETYATYEGGDHTIVVGQVVRASREAPAGWPLAYYRGSYLDPIAP